MAFKHFHRLNLKLIIGTAGLFILIFVIHYCFLSKDLVADNADVDSREEMNPETVQEHLSSPPIIFAETSGRIFLEARAACSIESAAFHHPHTQILLYTLNEYFPQDPYATVLNDVSNVHIKRLDLNQIFNGTPLAIWHQEDHIKESMIPAMHLSDAVRLAVLWKLGGVYLDTDVIVIRSLDELRNVVALQEKEEANGAIMIFDRKSDFISKCMSDYIKNYSGKKWSQQGPGLITRLLKDVCKTDSLQKIVGNPHACPGVTLLTEESFYPLPYPEWYKLFEKADTVHLDLSKSYTVHLWGAISRLLVTLHGRRSLLDQLAWRNCPLTYQRMAKDKMF